MLGSVHYQILGPLEATGSDGTVALGGPKQRLVLSVLLIRLGQVVSDERLIDELWPEAAPDGARHAIQTYVSELRRVLDDQIERAGAGYRLRADPRVVDAHHFETLVAAARARSADALGGGAALFREALGLWHGEPYGGVADSPMLRAEIHRLTELRIAVVEDRVAADLDAGRHAEVASELEALTREYPFRERMHALRMLALYRGDRQAEALRAYHHARRWLDEEMGLDPSVELQELERRILNQDPSLRPVAAVAATPLAVSVIGTDRGGPALRGGFELREMVGRGTLGSTYRAYQPSIGREVAITICGDAVRRDPAFARSFEAGARRLAELDHPNVLPLLDWWREADEACVVRPWMRGGSLRAAIGRQTWSLSATLRLAEQVGGGLAAAHRRGVVHGHLTAHNVLLDTEGNAFVGDFALLSPAPGKDGEQPSTRGDIRSLAVLLVGVLTGRLTDDANPVLRLTQRRNELPADLIAVLAQASSAVLTDRHERVDDLLRDLRRAVGADVVAPAPSKPEADRVRNPYKGLQAFAEPDAPDFFGRGRHVQRLVDAVRAHALVVVAGPSGSGKSSLVRAGLLPELRAQPLNGAADWQVAELFPGNYPFEELERALLRAGVERPDDLYGDLVADEHGLATAARQLLPDGTNLLLIVDQLEEVWSLTEDGDVRRRFLAALVAAATDPAGRLRIVCTLRADFLDRAMETHDFAELTRLGLVLVTAPSREELAEAVAMPAQQVGLQFEAGLVERIVRDVDDEPGALPLLQHAMTELVASRDGHRLTVAAYEATGGVTGALGRRAESVYLGLPPDAQELARQVFLRLVTVDELNDDARRRVRRTELGALNADAASVDEILRRFGAYRLLTFDRDPVTHGPTVEVAHEALFREWARLQTWIDTRRDDLLRHRALRRAAADWLAAGESDDYLFAAGRLSEAERWLGATDLGLADDERRFLAASQAMEAATARRRRRWRRVLAVAASIAVTSVLAFAALSFLQLGRAELGEREAQARALAASSGAQLKIDQDLAVLLAIEAVSVSRRAGDDPLPEAIDALHAALAEHRTTVTANVGGFFVAFLDGQQMFSTGGPEGPGARPTLWDATTGSVVKAIEPGGSHPLAAAVGARGRLVAETYADAPTTVWDAATGRRVIQLGSSTPGAVPIATTISDDGALLAQMAIDDFRTGAGTVQMFDIASGEMLWERSAARVVALELRSGWLAVMHGTSTEATLLDPLTGRQIRTIGPRSDPDAGAVDLAVDAASQRMAVLAHGPSRVEVVNLTTGLLERTITVGADPNAVCLVTGGGWVAVSAADELVHIWDIESGAPVMSLPGTNHLAGLACDPSARRIAVAGDGGMTRIFDLGAAGPAEVSSFEVESPTAGRWAPDGDIIVSHADGALRRYANDGRLLAATPDDLRTTPRWMAMSVDGSLVAAEATLVGDNALPFVMVFDGASFAPLRRMSGPGSPLAFSDDGILLLTGGEDGGAIYEVGTGRRVATLASPIDGGPFTAPTGVFLPDGEHVLVHPAAQPEAWIYDIASGQPVATVCSAGDAIEVAVTPSGDALLIGGFPASVESWRLPEVLTAAMGAPSMCARDGGNPSDAARLDRWSASATGGVRFTPDGRLVAATSGEHGALGVWDLAAHQPLLQTQFPGSVWVLGFDPAGRYLAIALQEPRGLLHAVRILAVDASDLLTVAKDRVTRRLTPQECASYLRVACP
jgi:DNA-binding SARP family transcriptional activator/WD40 repeat protein